MFAMDIMPNGNMSSKYEKVRIISARALQIAQGAPPLVKVPKSASNAIDIAMLEWQEGLIPIEARKRQL